MFISSSDIRNISSFMANSAVVSNASTIAFVTGGTNKKAGGKKAWEHGWLMLTLRTWSWLLKQPRPRPRPAFRHLQYGREPGNEATFEV